jgi:hypothetical protein
MVAKRVPGQLNKFLRELADNLDRAIKEKVIEKEWLDIDPKGGSRRSVLHSRVLGILAGTGFQLEYEVGIEARFKAGKSWFQPDVELRKKNHLISLIEYESTNSSDSRVISKDLAHCFKVLESQDGELPDYWIIIYTLPDGRVGTWYHYDYPAGNSFSEMARNPHRFYRRGFKEPVYFSMVDKPRRCSKIAMYRGISEYYREARQARQQVFLVNLTKTGLEIDFPSSLNKKYLFKPSSRSGR